MTRGSGVKEDGETTWRKEGAVSEWLFKTFPLSSRNNLWHCDPVPRTYCVTEIEVS